MYREKTDFCTIYFIATPLAIALPYLVKKIKPTISMNCKICNRISKSSFCSQECKDIFWVQNTKIKEKKIKKAKIQKLRFCVCGEELKRYQHICNKCKLKLRDEELEKRVEYGILGKCLHCGDDIIGFINKKYVKKFCTSECQKKYSYALAKKNRTL